MTALEQFISPALTRALGWTLLHSLWQGALVAAVLAGALLLLRHQRAEVRYRLAVAALAVIVGLAGLTFGLYFRAGTGAATGLSQNTERGAEWTNPVSAPATRAGVSAALDGQHAAQHGTAAAASAVAPAWLAAGQRYFDQHLPLLVVAWGLGLLAMSLRLMGGLLYVQRLRRYRVRPLGAAWQARLAALAGRCGIRQPVALLESALVRVPLVVGHVRPLILLPLGAVAGLPPTYLEAILAHELAHVLRRDYLVNLLQTVAEALFFYHPAVWFVGRCVRTERENCCDDQATALCNGDALRLARALTALAEWCQGDVGTAAPRLALAAIGGRGALLGRVRRLVQRRPAAATLAEGLLAGALVLGGLGLLGGSVVLAGTSSPHPLISGQPVAFDWQTEPAPRPPKAGGVADTIRVRTKPASAAVPPSAAAVPARPEAAAFPPDIPDPAQLRRMQRDALRQAERALREASNALKGLSSAQHQRISKELADVQAQLRAAEQGFTAARRPRTDEGAENHPDDEKLRRREEQLRDREEERRDHEEEMRDREEDRHNHEEELRDREESRRDHEEALHDREESRHEHAAGMRERPEAQHNAAADALVAELLKDGLIKDRNNFQFRLTARNLEVDGREQPPKVFRKYLKLHETHLGHPLSTTGSFDMDHRSVSFGNERGMPPPRPPRLPKLPPPPPAMTQPTPPRPPQAPAGPQ